MNSETIVAVFENATHADRAISDLEGAGISRTAIERHGGAAGYGEAGSTTTTAAPMRQKGFWGNLFGGEPGEDASVYDSSVERGSTVVTVRAETEAEASRVADILERHQPIDIDNHASGLATASPVMGGAYAPTATTDTMPTGGAIPAASGTGDKLQLSEESLVVGKRLVNRGGTRIRRYVVETPVEQQVSLHDERVVVDRHPVTDGRPVAANAFTDNERVIEMTETAEEAVVGKTAHVVEEVSLRREGVDHTETVHDTVRKEEVAVERTAGTDEPAERGTRRPLPGV